MKIEIPDELTGSERRRRLQLEPLQYALERFDGSKEKASLWLGMSARWIRRLVKKFPELEQYNVRNIRDIQTKSKMRKAIKHGADIRDTAWYKYANDREKRYLDRMLKEVSAE